MRVSHFKLRIRLLMAIFSSTAVQCGYFRTNDVMLASVYVGQIYFLQISELASMKQPKYSLQLAKPTRNSRKIANKLTTVASGKINMQSKHNLVCHIPKVKAATSAHSWLTQYLFSVFNIPNAKRLQLHVRLLIGKRKKKTASFLVVSFTAVVWARHAKNNG